MYLFIPHCSCHASQGKERKKEGKKLLPLFKTCTAVAGRKVESFKAIYIKDKSVYSRVFDVYVQAGTLPRL